MLVARGLPHRGLERLAAACEVRTGGMSAQPGSLRELAQGVDGIVADPSVLVDDPLLEAAGPRLKAVANFGVGYDNIDLDACRRRGIVATNTPDVLTDSTAELALGLTLSAARHIAAADADLRAGRWTGLDPEGYLGVELSGASFGVLGMGRIGRRYAELVAALAGEILYTGRAPKPDAERELGAVRVEFHELLTRADVLSVHLPLSTETDRLIGRDQLRAMKCTAILVNTARGRLVDSVALAEALAEGEIGAAGLDVYDREPDVPAELLTAPRCVLLPHIGSATRRARDAMAASVVANLLTALRGGEPPNRVG